MEKKVNPLIIIFTGIAVVIISLYVNYTSYRNLFFGKMIVFIVIGFCMLLYGLFRYFIKQPKHASAHHLITRHQTPRHSRTHCAGCGVPLPLNARFCPRCGRRI